MSEAEIEDLYALPRFTINERKLFFSLDKKEVKLIKSISDIPSKIYTILELGYFKAKNILFNFKFEDVERDIHFVINRYFPEQRKSKTILLKARKAFANEQILKVLGCSPFDSKRKAEILEYAITISKIHASHIDIFREVLSFLENNKIVLPGYTILQDIITFVVSSEYKRLENIIKDNITPELSKFLSGFNDMIEVEENSNKIGHKIKLNKASDFLKHQQRNFKQNQLKLESSKFVLFSRYYSNIKLLISKLGISAKCIEYYASMFDRFNNYRIENLQASFRQLCLICSIYRGRQTMLDNAITSFTYHNNTFYEGSVIYINEKFFEYSKDNEMTMPQVSKFLRFMGGDEEYGTLNHFLQEAYTIIPKSDFIPTANYIDGIAFDPEEVRWEYFVSKSKRIKLNMRPPFRIIEFWSNKDGEDVLEAIQFLQNVFGSGISLSKIASDKYPDKFIPKAKRKYLYSNIENNSPKSSNIYHPDKYEIFLYQTIAKEIEKGNIFCNESTKYKSFSKDLVSDKIWENKEELIQNLGYPNIIIDIIQRLDILEEIMHVKTLEVNRKIQNKENSSIKINENNEWHLSYLTSHSKEHNFFTGIHIINISDLLNFIQEVCNFCSAFEHMKPRYSKQKADIGGIIACIIANGLGFGTYKISQSSDLSYSFLSNIEQNFFSIENLREANDIVTNKISSLGIFNKWNIILDKALASVDGQKFETRLENFQSRYSSKYFGMNKGIVAYSMVLNHVPVNSKIIGANEHESHYLYDIIYNNTSDAEIDAVSGDMHSINRVNFAILDSISKDFMPNFSNPEAQCKTLRSLKPISLYEDAFIKPTKAINKKLIIDEWDNIQRIFVSLASQETTQANIVRKLSSHKRYSKTKTALWEYDAIFRSLHLLDFIDNSEMRSQIRRALNRIEDYHQLRRAISRMGGSKLRGKNALENEMWNQCSRLIANCIILYNAMILDQLYDEYEKQGDLESLELLKKISPIRWEHINFVGKYIFTKGLPNTKMVDIINQIKNNLHMLTKKRQ